ncbi:CaiB/BaiF CoA transferase family protein [Georgenia yuyongxinii]|uniref:CoA transferase n=1 Tax=Georgenia yuyongxinii TaxID=2589797 RepID=A0A552WXL0_9MICO|nr:CoA transferase [Georgenia yuyongxinii]TRW47571.1 CoA transferase [Georgenia yuyongxinii]
MTDVLPRGALDGMKVLDLSRWIAGPFATMLMADAGADVIKVEGLLGEDARHTAPSLADSSAYVHHYNRNKRALALDLRDPRSQEILRSLATDWADVIVENFRPGILERLGLDYETLRLANPALIMTSVSGYGESGPDSDRPCFNTIAEAFSGAMSLTGDASAPPTMSGYFAADHGTGLYTAIGTLLAWVERQRTGVGQRVELALTDAMFSLLGFALTAKMNDLPFPDRSGNRDSATAPADLFVTADDRPVYLDAGTDTLFRNLCEVMGTPELADDPRFVSNEARIDNLDLLHDRIETWAASVPFEVLRSGLDRAGIPFSAVNTVEEAITDPQLRARGMVAEVTTEDGQRINVPGMVLNLSATPGRIVSAAPPVGRHTVEILHDLCGLTTDEIDELRRRRVIGTHEPGQAPSNPAHAQQPLHEDVRIKDEVKAP